MEKVTRSSSPLPQYNARQFTNIIFLGLGKLRYHSFEVLLHSLTNLIGKKLKNNFLESYSRQMF